MTMTSQSSLAQSPLRLSAVLIAASLMLCSCSGVLQELQIETVPEQVKLPPLTTYPRPRQIDTRKFEFRVLTPETIPEAGENYVFFGLTAGDYERLGLTWADTVRYIREMNKLLDVYERDIQERFPKQTKEPQ